VASPTTAPALSTILFPNVVHRKIPAAGADTRGTALGFLA